MNNNFIIRNETPDDYRAVENLTREAFWNVYKEGADEHYFVHVMRSHEDFIPELSLSKRTGRLSVMLCTPRLSLLMKRARKR